jgi:hypothetical protein
LKPSLEKGVLRARMFVMIVLFILEIDWSCGLIHMSRIARAF